MNGRQLTDTQISQALRAHLPDRARAELRERILEAAETTTQQRALPSFLGALSEADPVVRRRSLLIAAALLVALALASVAAVGALLLERDPVQDLSLEPPSPTTAALLWTQASLDEDWPAPVRPEPAGGAAIVQLAAGYSDPLGDVDASFPWIDIRKASGLWIDLVDNRPPLVDPTEQRIAYGIVVDSDRDGVPDLRFGIDNVRVIASGETEHRAWITDLATGRTTSAVGEPYGYVGETYFDTFWPGGWTECVPASPLPSGAGKCREQPRGARLSFGGDVAGGGHTDQLRSPFYAWASAIEDGRVVATDYAPDTGWLDPSPDGNP